ncbi:MAG TPA: PQQ-binding-like beta-propeller repeat protein, partial [Vicinamibacterales bacterium]|nr:PQQ-binding-like beta-propeller repeat protein [Vicinamibacterales bacterium]
LKVGGVALVAIAVVGVALYLLGMRIILDGGGMPSLAFVQSTDAQAESIARHREAQKAGGPPPAAPAPPPAPAPSDSGAPTAPVDPATVVPLPKPAATATRYWTDFRGPDRSGHYRELPIRTDWPATGLKPLWKQPVGGGYASFVAADGHVFTIEQRGPQEVVAAYDILTGRELWTNAWGAVFSESMGGDGPRATPTFEDGRIYALGGAGELRALDAATGTVLWRTNILADAGATNLQWGMSAAPLVVDNAVVVLPGGPNGNSVVAYDRVTGKRAWSALDDDASYASPMLVTLGGVRQILVFTAKRLVSLDAASHTVLWEFPWTTQYGVNASQPLLLGDDRVFVSTGYGSGAAAIQLTKDGDRFSVRELWRTNLMKNQFTSSVLHEGFIYGLDESILACLDASTGARKWKAGRYGYGQVMLASGQLIVLTESGELALVRATPDAHQEVARFAVIEGKTWNHPAISGGFLVIRNLNEMAAFDLRR